MRLPLSLCLGFGVGSFGISILLNTVTTFFPALMTTVLGQSAALAGLLLTVSKLYDAIADLVIGGWSDRTRSRWGRRRPYLLAGAVIAGLSFLLLFAPPKLEGFGLIAWMAFALIVYSTGYSLFSVPYVAMAGEITDGYHERTRLLSYRTFFISLGQIVSSAGTAALIGWAGGGRLGYALMGGTTGALLSATMLASFFGTRGARTVVVRETPRIGRMAVLKSLANNRPFVLLMTIKVAQYVGIAIIGTTKLLFLLNVSHLGYRGLINLSLVQNIVGAASLPLWVWAGRRFGKRAAYMAGTLLLALVYVSWFWTDAGLTMPQIWWRGALNGIAASGVILMSIAMLPDVMEYDRLRTGVRREGLFSSIYTITEKASYAVGAGAVGLILAAGGYLPTTKGAIIVQPDSAVSALYAGASWVPAALIMVSFVLMIFYPLDESMLREAEARG